MKYIVQLLLILLIVPFTLSRKEEKTENLPYYYEHPSEYAFDQYLNPEKQNELLQKAKINNNPKSISSKINQNYRLISILVLLLL